MVGWSASRRPAPLRAAGRRARPPWWVRTFETLALMGGAVVLAGLAARPMRARWVRLGGVLYGVSLPVFGVLHFIYADNVASLVPAFYPWPLFWAYLTGAGNIVGGAAIALGVVSRLAAILAGGMYGAYALTLHVPRAISIYLPQLTSGDAAVLQTARAGLTSLCVAIAMWGSAWIVAGSLAGRDVSTFADEAPEPPSRQAGEAS